MRNLPSKTGWLAAGTLLGVGASLLLGAAQQPEPHPMRYDIDVDLTIGGVILTAHDREENNVLIYRVVDESAPDDATIAANLLGVIDLGTLGEDTLQGEFAEEDAGVEPGED